MLGNIWLSSALIVTAIFSVGAMYKSYSDIQEAKQVQEHYEIISEIKTLLAKQYNKNPQDITRDEIIAHLPKGGNWEKVLLLDRQKDSNLSNKALVNEDGKIEISEDAKLKLLALKAKLKDVVNVSSMTLDSTTKNYTFEVGKSEKNSIKDDLEIEKSIIQAIDILSKEILYTSGANKSSILEGVIKNLFETHENYYLFDGLTKEKKEEFFKSKIKEKLYKNESAIETRLYKELESLL